MKEYLIVDGYNIIGAWPELQALKEENLEYARARLIEILSAHAALSLFQLLNNLYQIAHPGYWHMLNSSRRGLCYTIG